jgi:hypothetical protein
VILSHTEEDDDDDVDSLPSSSVSAGSLSTVSSYSPSITHTQVRQLPITPSPQTLPALLTTTSVDQEQKQHAQTQLPIFSSQYQQYAQQAITQPIQMGSSQHGQYQQYAHQQSPQYQQFTPNSLFPSLGLQLHMPVQSYADSVMQDAHHMAQLRSMRIAATTDAHMAYSQQLARQSVQPVFAQPTQTTQPNVFPGFYQR